VTDWPALPYDGWADTLDTLHMVMQIMGKVRVALSPKEPEWAHITLYVSARGLTTGPVPSNVGLFEVEADFLDHDVVVRTASGRVERIPLCARPIAEFWAEFTDALQRVGVEVALPSMPQEVPDPIPFPDDTVHRTYDPQAAARFWRVLTVVEPVFAEYRAAYQGKVSRVHLYWGHTDLNVTRFSGAPYDQEEMSVGWWPGDANFRRAAFYAYNSPKPEGIQDARLDVPGAYWDTDLGEFILPYDDVRAAPSPAAALRAFLDAAYDACSSRANWDPRLIEPHA
jgi:hypothetical protein